MLGFHLVHTITDQRLDAVAGRVVRPFIESFEGKIRGIMNVDVCPGLSPSPSPTPKPGMTGLQELIWDISK